MTKLAERPCGNCRHPECTDCYPRPTITTERDPSRHVWALSKLQTLTNKRFYGKFTLMFEDGKITRGEILESIKP